MKRCENGLEGIFKVMEGIVKRIDIEDGELTLYTQVFANSVANALLEALLKGIEWRQDSINIAGRSVLVPRLQAWYGDPGISYSYSGLRLESTPWSGTLSIIREKVNSLTGVPFNAVLLNQYRNGKDSVGWHSDDEPELGTNPSIASLSFGDVRKFVLQHRRDKSKKYSLLLKHNSLLLMGGALQHHWRHCLPKTATSQSNRINLTFRQIKVLT